MCNRGQDSIVRHSVSFHFLLFYFVPHRCRRSRRAFTRNLSTVVLVHPACGASVLLTSRAL